MLFQSSPALIRSARLRNLPSRECEEKQTVPISPPCSFALTKTA